MENQTYNISSDMATRNSLVVDGISPHTTLNSLVQSYLFDQTSDFHVTNQAENVVSSDAFYAYKRNVARDASLGGSSAAANREFEETPDSAVSIASFVAAKYGLQENLNNLAISVVPSIYSSEVLADYVPNDCSIASNPRFPTPVNCGNDEVLGMINGQWDMQKYRTPQFSQVILGSRYLCAVQEILAQIASFSLENVDHSNYFKAFDTPCSSNFPEERGLSLMDPFSNGGRPEGEIDPALHRRAMKTKKAKLLALLQMVDDCYNQCLDEIHTVISAFHAATELDPQIHARFALQTISTLYKSLRERISNHCLAMGSSFDASCSGDTEKSFESSFVQKQWALQQLKKKEHQLWRPQRGLPERSVSVLRAWMFQNFLHPYPKDAEKHLLAVRSGLTRNQVSNWFINARVRLWKPMIEEMYAEMNRRKSRRNDNTESSNNNQINHTTSTNNNQRYHHVN